jgi:hypothetical protein
MENLSYFKYNFNEDEWVIYLIEDNDHVITDEHIAAEVKFDEREIYFRKSEISLKVVLHEIWHVYFSYCYLNDTNSIELSDFEEITACLFSDKCESMLNTAKTILNRLLDIRHKSK